MTVGDREEDGSRGTETEIEKYQLRSESLSGCHRPFRERKAPSDGIEIHPHHVVRVPVSDRRLVVSCVEIKVAKRFLVRCK